MTGDRQQVAQSATRALDYVGTAVGRRTAAPEASDASAAELLQRAVRAGAGAAAITLLSRLDASRLDEHDRVVLLQAWAAQEGWLLAARTAALVAVAGAEPHPSGASTGDPAVVDEESVVAEVAVALRVSTVTATSQIATARALHGPLRQALPTIAAGRWGYGHARVAEDELCPLLVGATDVQLPARQSLVSRVLAEVLPHAADDTPARLRRRIRTTVARLDADDLVKRCERASRRRKVSLQPMPDLQGRLSIDAPWAQVAWIHRVVDAWARRHMSSADPAPSASTLDSLRVDGVTEAARLLAVAMGLADLDPRPAEAPDHLDHDESVAAVAEHLRRVGAVVMAPEAAQGRRSSWSQAVVVMSEESLLGATDDPGWVPGYGAVPAAVARALAADAGTWIGLPPLATSSGAGQSDTSRTSMRYRPSSSLRQALVAGFATCAFPGCARSAAECDADHVTPFDGGNTTLANLQPLCRRHHRLKTFGSWSLEGRPLRSPLERAVAHRLARRHPTDGGPPDRLWTSPAGHLRPAHPDPPWDTAPPAVPASVDLHWSMPA